MTDREGESELERRSRSGRSGGRGRLAKSFGTSFGTRDGTRRFAAGYQTGLECVASLVIATLAGAWVDAQLDTAPLLLVVGSVLGFGSCILRLWRYQKARDAEARQEGDDRG